VYLLYKIIKQMCVYSTIRVLFGILLLDKVVWRGR